MVGAMFIRRTQTRRTEDGKPYFSHRLVHAERLGSTVRQRTLLNLGRQSLLRKPRSAEFLPEATGRARSADGAQHLQEESERHRRPGAGDAGVHGACLPVMRASTREETRRISFTSRSSSRLFSIHSR